jgi:hypothetical protein
VGNAVGITGELTLMNSIQTALSSANNLTRCLATNR